MKKNFNLIYKKNAKQNGLENLKDPKPFIEHSNIMQGVYKNIEGYNQAENVMCYEFLMK